MWQARQAIIIIIIASILTVRVCSRVILFSCVL
jgi:hypothetical protein